MVTLQLMNTWSAYDLHVSKRLTMGTLALHRPEGRELESLQLNLGQVHPVVVLVPKW